MRAETVQVTFTVREQGDTIESIALVENLLVVWRDGQWEVTYPLGHESWVGHARSRNAALLNYLASRLGIEEH